MRQNQYELPLFSFGTLQDEDVFRIASGGLSLLSVTRGGGWVDEHAAYAVRGGCYPVMFRMPGRTVRGTVFQGLPAAVIDRLIWFEAPEFVLSRIRVNTDEGPLDCTYFSSQSVPEATEQPWSLERWEALHKQGWMQEAEFAINFYGVCDARDIDRHWDDIIAYVGGAERALPDAIRRRCDQLLLQDSGA